MVHGAGSEEMIEYFIATFVGEDEETEVETMLKCHSCDSFQDGRHSFEMDVSEKQGHDKGMNEAHFGAVL